MNNLKSWLLVLALLCVVYEKMLMKENQTQLEKKQKKLRRKLERSSVENEECKLQLVTWEENFVKQNQSFVNSKKRIVHVDHMLSLVSKEISNLKSTREKLNTKIDWLQEVLSIFICLSIKFKF